LSDLGFRALQRSAQIVHCGLTSSSTTAELHAHTPSLGEITALLLSWRPHLEASNLSRVRTAPTPTTEHLDRSLADWGEPRGRGQHPAASTSSLWRSLSGPSSASTATRHHWLQHLFNWLDEREIYGMPMAKMRALEPREARTCALRRSRPAKPCSTCYARNTVSEGCSLQRCCPRSAVRPAGITGCQLLPRPPFWVVLFPFEDVHVVTQQDE
jgi:hypothetical protein